MKCIKCKKNLEDNVTVCPYCNHKINLAEEKKKANTIAIIDVISMGISFLLEFLLLLGTNYGSYISFFQPYFYIACIILTIYGYVKYPNSKFMRVLFFLMIGSVALSVLGLIIFFVIAILKNFA